MEYLLQFGVEHAPSKTLWRTHHACRIGTHADTIRSSPKQPGARHGSIAADSAPIQLADFGDLLLLEAASVPKSVVSSSSRTRRTVAGPV
jgi:hypothetical protein